MDNVVLRHSSVFRWQFAACRSIYWFFINIAPFSYFALSSCFFSISLTYHNQCSKHWVYAPGRGTELCSSMYGWMLQDGGHSYRFTLHIDRSFYDTYAITDPYCVSKLCLQFRLHVLTYLEEAWRYHVDQSSINSVWSLELSYCTYNPCTCTDELSCLTIWSPKETQCRHVA
jgi:hypothetical protein